MPDYPARAKWITEDEKSYIEARIAVRGGGYTKAHAGRKEVLYTVFHPRMIAHYFAYLYRPHPPPHPHPPLTHRLHRCDMIPLGSMTFFAPTIVNGLGYSSLRANLMTVPPWIFGYLICLLLAWSADRHNARGFHVAASSLVGATGWLVQACLPANAYHARYAMLFFCAAGAFPSANPLSGWVTCMPTPSIASNSLA